MSKRLRTSYLWSYFTVSDESNKIARCDLCGQCCSYKTTPTNLKKHLASKHPTVNLPTKDTTSKEKNYSSTTDTGSLSPSSHAASADQHTPSSQPAASPAPPPADHQRPSTSQTSTQVPKPISQMSILSFAPPKKINERKKRA